MNAVKIVKYIQEEKENMFYEKWKSIKTPWEEVDKIAAQHATQ